MNEELSKQLEEHLAGFSARHKEVEEMKTEWKEFKSRALTMILGAVILFSGYGIWVGTIQANAQNTVTRLDIQTNRIATIDNRQQAADVTSAEIKAKLINIEATLLEIKQSLRIR